MQQDTYKGDVLQKIAGVSFILGAILLVVFGILNPGKDPGDLSKEIQNIADSNGGFWQIDHIFIAVSFWAFMIGIVGVYRSISHGGAAAWARVGFYGVIIATTLRSVFLAFQGVGLAVVVEQWETASAADKAEIFVVFSSLYGLLDGIRSTTDIFYGLSHVLLGVGIALSTVYPRWLGWAIIIVGIGWTVVGFVIGVSGMSAALVVPFGIVIILTVLWHLVMGIVITRSEIQAM